MQYNGMKFFPYENCPLYGTHVHVIHQERPCSSSAHLDSSVDESHGIYNGAEGRKGKGNLGGGGSGRGGGWGGGVRGWGGGVSG